MKVSFTMESIVAAAKTHPVSAAAIIILPLIAALAACCARVRSAKKKKVARVKDGRGRRKTVVGLLKIACPCKPGCPYLVMIGRDVLYATTVKQRSCAHCEYIPNRLYFVSPEELRQHLRCFKCQLAQGREPVADLEMARYIDRQEIFNSQRLVGDKWRCHLCEKLIAHSCAPRHVVHYCNKRLGRPSRGGPIYAFPVPNTVYID